MEKVYAQICAYMSDDAKECLSAAPLFLGVLSHDIWRNHMHWVDLDFGFWIFREISGWLSFHTC